MQTCTLNGTWQLSAGHRSLESVDMQIPGTVLSGLLAAGKIKDPFYRTNAVSYTHLDVYKRQAHIFTGDKTVNLFN